MRGAVMEDREVLMTAQELADYLGYSNVKSVYNFKYNGRGPKVTRVNGGVRFKKGDVQDWIAAQNSETEGEDK